MYVCFRLSVARVISFLNTFEHTAQWRRTIHIIYIKINMENPPMIIICSISLARIVVVKRGTLRWQQRWRRRTKKHTFARSLYYHFGDANVGELKRARAKERKDYTISHRLQELCILRMFVAAIHLHHQEGVSQLNFGVSFFFHSVYRFRFYSSFFFVAFNDSSASFFSIFTFFSLSARAHSFRFAFCVWECMFAWCATTHIWIA